MQEGASADVAVRDMHPFPIFERYVDKDVRDPGTGQVAVQAGSHAIIFSADLAGSSFPIFGAGEPGWQERARARG